jgi:hypothetical protein
MKNTHKLLCGALGIALMTGCGEQDSAASPGGAGTRLTQLSEESTLTEQSVTTGTEPTVTTKKTTDTEPSRTTAAVSDTESGTASTDSAVSTSATESDVQSSSASSETVSTESEPALTDTSTEHTATETTSTEEPYRDFTLDAAQQALLAEAVIIGDGQFAGEAAAGALPDSVILALEGMGVSDVFENVFAVQEQPCGVLDALRTLHPKYIICALGLNDIRSDPGEERFALQYRSMLTALQDASPEADIFAVSAAPAAAETGLNELLDRYNGALHSMLADAPDWHWVDIAPELKNGENALKPRYHEADGLHLTEEGFSAYLWQLSDQMRAYTDLNTEPEQPNE